MIFIYVSPLQCNISDVIFFDESIDAKMNRYMFKFRNIDTPFLLDNANLHAKTYVTPTPNTDGLCVDGGVSTVYEYQRFPALRYVRYVYGLLSTFLFVFPPFV